MLHVSFKPKLSPIFENFNYHWMNLQSVNRKKEVPSFICDFDIVATVYQLFSLKLQF